MGELFHADFQRHLKAISMLQQVRDLKEVPEAVLMFFSPFAKN